MSYEEKFDYLLLHSKCKAICYSVVSLDIEIYKPNIHYLITPTTESGYCVFLRRGLQCNIQDDKPGICKKYGNEKHQCLRCPFQDKHGNVRSRQQSRVILREASKAKDKLLAKAEKFLKKEENNERINNEIRLQNTDSNLHSGNSGIPNLYSSKMQGVRSQSKNTDRASSMRR